MSLEMTLLLGVLLGCVCAAAAHGDQRQPRAAAPITATVTVMAPSRALPDSLANQEIRVDQIEPLGFGDLVGRVADEIGVAAVLEDRPGRVAEGDLALQQPVPFGLVMTGTVPAVLDELARLSGYDWSWSDGRLVFFRYRDVEQRRPSKLPGGVSVEVLAALAAREAGAEAAQAEEAAAAEGEGTSDAEVAEAGRLAAGVPGQVDGEQQGPVDPEAVAAVEGQGEAAPAEQVPAEPAGWEVDPERHDTVEGVLKAWAERADWQVAWETERRFEVGASALFEGREDEQQGFLAAVDALLAIDPMRRTLAATAYPNRWLVIRDVGSSVQ